MHSRQTHPRHQQQRRESIATLHEEFRLSVRYEADGTDSELVRDITDWLRQADQLPETTVLDYIERRLSDLQQRTDGDERVVGQYDMYRSGDDGPAEFPDACRDCRHYGSRCPVFNDPTQLDKRDQLQADLADAAPSRVKTRYRTFARENDCHQIPAFIREYEDRYQGLATEGWRLYQRLEVDVGYTDEQQEGEALAADPDMEVATNE